MKILEFSDKELELLLDTINFFQENHPTGLYPESVKRFQAIRNLNDKIYNKLYEENFYRNAD